MPQRLRVAVLASGNGSNLQAILDAWRDGKLPIEPVLVLSDKATARALERAKQANVPVKFIDPKAYKSRQAFDAELVKALRTAKAELIVLAGFMRLLSTDFLEAFPDRVINLHPSLLPAYPGLNAIQQALDAGAKVTGCTVHLVDAGLDSGPIILQSRVDVGSDDSLESLSAKVHALEHRTLVEVIGLFAAGRVRVNGRKVTLV